MTIQEALKIVIELAEDNRLTSRNATTPELQEKMKLQRAAVAKAASHLQGLR